MPTTSEAVAIAVAAVVAGVALAGLIYLAAGPARLPRPAGPGAARPVAGRTLAILVERTRVARRAPPTPSGTLWRRSIQTAAAGRVLDSNPEFAREALGHIAASAREGQRDLDHVLGLLREEPAPGAPAPDLTDLDRLLDTRDVELTGDVDGCPESCRRGLPDRPGGPDQRRARHAEGAPVSVRVAVRDDRLELELANPAGRARPGGGAGAGGIQERVVTLRGRMSAGIEDAVWRVGGWSCRYELAAVPGRDPPAGRAPRAGRATARRRADAAASWKPAT